MSKSVYLFLLFCLSILPIYAQEKEYKLNEIVVTAERIPVLFSDLARTVTVLDSTDIQSLPADNIQDLLKYVNALDLKTRGTEGVQADAGIRGGTFEETLIMIDGVKISDPQTGHHNLNLPLIPDNIERIEILKGQGSRVFGPNAFGGAVNIITRKEKGSSLQLSLLAGEHNLYNLAFTSSYPVGIFGNNFSFSKKKSDGYRHNTNFDITTFSLSQNVSLTEHTVNIFFGYIDKKFGANNYYSDLFPNQWEHTTTKMLNVAAGFGKDKFIVSPKIFWRRNDDNYILDYSRPDFYHNIHKTYSYGGELQSSIKTNFGTTTLGGEINKEEINSRNLGSHSRLKSGIFGEQFFEPIDFLSVSLGFFAYNYSNTGWKFWPGFDAAYKISKDTKIFVSYGKAFRIPTYTDLYYVGPANLGNPNLTYETTTNYETGFNISRTFFESNISIFYKDGKNIIDWARASASEPWRVENVTNVKTIGSEFSLTLFPQELLYLLPFTKLKINYTYLSVERSTGVYESKYLLDNLRHQLILNVDNKLPFGLKQNWSFILRSRVNFESQFTVDTQISTHLKDFALFLRATNLFNKLHKDFPRVVLPGRWITAGIKYSLTGY